jgi:hypothetical protein
MRLHQPKRPCMVVPQGRRLVQRFAAFGQNRAWLSLLASGTGASPVDLPYPASIGRSRPIQQERSVWSDYAHRRQSSTRAVHRTTWVPHQFHEVGPRPTRPRGSHPVEGTNAILGSDRPTLWQMIATEPWTGDRPRVLEASGSSPVTRSIKRERISPAWASGAACCASVGGAFRWASRNRLRA